MRKIQKHFGLGTPPKKIRFGLGHATLYLSLRILLTLFVLNVFVRDFTY